MLNQGKKQEELNGRALHYAWHSRFDVAEDDSGNLCKVQRRHPGGVLLILCGIFGKVSVRFFDFDIHQIECQGIISNLVLFKQDLFAVSCFLPLLTHRARELGASPSLVGVIGMYGVLYRRQLDFMVKMLYIGTQSLCTQQCMPTWR